MMQNYSRKNYMTTLKNHMRRKKTKREDNARDNKGKESIRA